MKLLSQEFPEFIGCRFRIAEMQRATASGDALALHLLGDGEDAEMWMLNRICRIYELPITTTEQRRWLRFRWARYRRLRRWYALGNPSNERGCPDYATEIREIEREIAVAETRIEAMLGAPAVTPARVREGV